MPWYWTDDIARVLIESGRLDDRALHRLTTVPVAFRRDEATIEAAAQSLLDDDEIPIAA